MLTLGIIGSTGRLGQAVMKAAASAGIPVVLTSDRSGSFSSAVPSVLVCTAKQPGVATAAVLAGELGRPLVVATSGLLSSDRQHLAALAERVPVLLAANLARGHQLQKLAMAAAAGALAPGDADAVTIVDRHSPRKADRPSATARALAAAWIDAAPAGAEVSMVSIRAGAPVADHTVMITLADDEVFVIEHRVPSLKAAAKGALRAAAWLVGQDPGLYDTVPVDIPSHLPPALATAAPSDTPAAAPSDAPTAVPSNTPAAVPSDTPPAARSGTPSAVAVFAAFSSDLSDVADVASASGTATRRRGDHDAVAHL